MRALRALQQERRARAMPVSSRLFALLRLAGLLCGACGLPLWYDSHRTHAHTRFQINRYCNATTKTCEPAFENAANLFNELGVKAFVRHAKTGEEGTWWPTGPQESWHPFVQATGRNLPKEFIEKAHANGQKIVLYYWPQSSAYYAKYSNMTWANRNAEGKTVKGVKGLGLCVNSPWRETYKSQLLELVDFGVDGFYIDHFPQPPEGCWCQYCQEKFHAWSGGLDLPKKANTSDPTYVKLLEFNTFSVEEHFREITEAIYAKSPYVVPIVSVYLVPCANDGHSLYETTRMVNATASTVAKTEFEIPLHRACVDVFKKSLHDNRFSMDVHLSFGYSIARDAASGRPAHVWIPKLRNASQAATASFVQMAYGDVANPDHAESLIPNHHLFNATYEMAGLLNPYLNGTRPLRWAGVYFSEEARNRYALRSAFVEWDAVLFPTVSAWEMLLRRHVPAGLITDWQLSINETDSFSTSPLYDEGYRAIVVPIGNGTADQERGLALFEKSGGRVYRIHADKGWTDETVRHGREKALWAQIVSQVGQPPVRVSLGNGEVSQVHATVSRSNATSFVVMIVNEFLWVYYKYPIRKQIAGASVNLAGVVARSVFAVDVLGRGLLKPVSSGNGNWTIDLPTFSQHMAVGVTCSEACW